MTDSALTLTDVRVHRSGRTVLEIDHLQVPVGAFVGVIGTNGAGKTTLLRVCAGLIQPNQGQVRLGQSDLTRTGVWRKTELRKRIGFVGQSAQYRAELPFTLREVVAMGRTSVRPLLSRLSARDEAIVDHWIDALGLADRRAQTFRSLSGGEQQKALIARAMAQDPAILMLDEPCANLDFNWKYQISEMVERLYRRHRVTVVMVSHDTSVLPSACRRIVLLSDGRVLGDGERGDVLSPDVLRRAYHEEFQAIALAGRTYVVNRRS